MRESCGVRDGGVERLGVGFQQIGAVTTRLFVTAHTDSIRECVRLDILQFLFYM
jgi:hypothetical protein